MRILPLVAALHLAGLWLAGKYHRVSTSSRLTEAMTIVRGSLIGSAASVVCVLYLTRFEGYSRQAFAVAAVFVVVFLAGEQLALRALDELLRRRHRTGPLAIVYGADRLGALAVRELANNPTVPADTNRVRRRRPGADGRAAGRHSGARYARPSRGPALAPFRQGDDRRHQRVGGAKGELRSAVRDLRATSGGRSPDSLRSRRGGHRPARPNVRRREIPTHVACLSTFAFPLPFPLPFALSFALCPSLCPLPSALCPLLS